ncbi:MAG: c-type cytochrome [Acidobacteriaceae bacterium]|nr:c-type cytochrome [Acidobacteriaceae bacterium]
MLLLCAAGCDPPGKPGPAEVPIEDVTDFHVLFDTYCQGCHGPEGKRGAARILNDPLYLAVLPRQELYSVIENGRPGTAMPAWALKYAGPLSEKQINSLVDGIENNWAKPAAFSGASLPSYYTQNSGDAAAGQKLFVRDCYMCHGPGARIGSVTDAAYLSLITDQCLRTSVIVGRPDFGMPNYRNLNLGRALNDQEITDIVAFLSAKRPPEITAMYESARIQPGQQTGATGAHENENGSGQTGTMTKGDEGSGTGPGSPQQKKREGNTSGSSQQGVK